ncbi:MAG TPA: nitroreductase family protein [Arenicellales bacterium]|jgi:nitroreductase|nr:hypothetical protein [Gammaproteobacteria bacterium]MDP6025699.1 nitroreductase family protein [Pseudomonadales bacterium]HJL51584.1 nitroreductase family protein [Arenicellales bacterium]MDP6314814.1 nitroreductase family protein [Pseudomonadales bacterium]MDP7313784.1 nitroreductase family protein [Pseudomonadales bacterium]|tara:strand:- start:816 stop:1568 length:753 start_codon:yes stop_codon:yes gene_type:complete
MSDSAITSESNPTPDGEKLVRRKVNTLIPEGSPWNEIEEAFLKRRSVRKYKRKQVPEHYIKRILEVGRYSASQGNCQPWRFVVVRDRDMINEMESYVLDMFKLMTSAPSQKGNNEAPPDPEQRPAMHPIPLGLLTQSPPGQGIKVFHGAPTLIFPLMDSRGIGHPEIDLGIVGTNMIMTAYSLGLGTCWVGFAESLNSGNWPKKLGVEEPYKLVEALAIGFEAGDAQHNYVHRETHRITWFENGEKRVMY